MPNHPILRTAIHPDRLPRDVARRVDEAHARAVEAAAEITGAGFATFVGMTVAEGVLAKESDLTRQYPLSERRLEKMADCFFGVTYRKISELGW